MTDLMLSRYGSLDYIMTLDFIEFFNLLEFAQKQKEDELIFQRWIAGPQFQISFDTFKEQLKPKPLKDNQEILSEVRDILSMTGGTPVGNL